MVNREHFWKLGHLSDRQLLERLQGVLRTQRCALAELVAHLGEVEERRLHLAAAHGSLFSYCVGQLGMSEDEACRRIDVARLARKFPLLFSELASGRVSLSVALLLKAVLTQDNHAELFAAARGASLRTARELLAARFPRPDVPSRIRKLPQRLVASPIRAAVAVTAHVANAMPTAAANVANAITATVDGGVNVANALPAAVADVAGAIPAATVGVANTSLVDVRPVHRASTTSGGGAVTTTAATLTASAPPSRSPEIEFRSLAGVRAQSLLQEPPIPAEPSQAPVHASLPAYADPRQRIDQRQRIDPLSADRYRIQFTADSKLKQKLELARDLLRHSHPSGDLAPIVSRALDLLLQELLQRRFGVCRKDTRHRSARSAAHAAPTALQAATATQIEALQSSTLMATAPAPARPGAAAPVAAPSATASPAEPRASAPQASAPQASAPLVATPGPASSAALFATAPSAAAPPAATPASYVARAARRGVLERDGLGCCWVDAEGNRCGNTAWLEFDHRHPSGKGGGSEPENLRLLCRAHNRFAAERAYGRDHVERAIQARQRSAKSCCQSGQPPPPSPARA